MFVVVAVKPKPVIRPFGVKTKRAEGREALRHIGGCAPAHFS